MKTTKKKPVSQKQSKKKYKTPEIETKISSLEKKYNIDLGLKKDMKLGEFLKKKGYPALVKLFQST